MIRRRFFVLTVFAAILLRTASAQNRVLIEGTVSDAETQKPIPGVNVTLRGQTIGTSTDSLGQFRLSVPIGSHIIAFTHIGYKKVIKGVTADSQLSVTWRIQMYPEPIRIGEVTVTARKPFSEQRALWTLGGAEFERLGESDMDRALRYLLPSIVSPWDIRMRIPSKDFTLYVNGEWMESIYLTDIDPFTVRRVLVSEGMWSPVGLPARRGKYVVAVETK